MSTSQTPKRPRAVSRAPKATPADADPRVVSAPADAEPRIVATLGPKGGIGKTLITCSFAAEAMKRGKRVLVVDADPRGGARMWAAMARKLGKPAPTILAVGATLGAPGELAHVVKGYDLALIDCPGQEEDTSQREALMICDLALFPCSPSPIDGWVLEEWAKPLVARARRARPHLRYAVIVSRTKPGTELAKNARQELGQITGFPVLNSEIVERINYQYAIGHGLGATTYVERGRDAADEMLDVYNEIFSAHKEVEARG